MTPLHGENADMRIKLMATIVLLTVVTLSTAHAVPSYSGIVLSTPTGTAAQYLSGSLCIAASSNSAGSCSIYLNGANGSVTASSFTGVVVASANYATSAGSAAALAATPSLCPVGQAAIGVSAAGNALGCFVPNLIAAGADGSVQLSTGGAFGSSNLIYGWTSGTLSLGGNGTMSLDGANVFTSTGPLNIYAGATPGSVVASSVSISGENAPAGINVARNGGSVNLSGGSAYRSGSGGAAVGGAVNISGGMGTTPGAGGAVNISGGLGASTGTINLYGATIIYNPTAQLAVSTFDAFGDFATSGTVAAAAFVGNGSGLTSLPPQSPAGSNGQFQWNNNGALAGASDVLEGASIGLTSGLVVGSTVASSNSAYVSLNTTKVPGLGLLAVGQNIMGYVPYFGVDSQNGVQMYASANSSSPVLTINTNSNALAGGNTRNMPAIYSEGSILIVGAGGNPAYGLTANGPITSEFVSYPTLTQYAISIFQGQVSTSTPLNPLNNNDANIFSTMDSILVTVQTGTAIYIDSSTANVGIGGVWSDSMQPSHALDVAGGGNFTGGVTASTFTTSGYYQLNSKTTAALQALAPTAVGQFYWCSDCTGTGAPTAGEMVVSTGTLAGNFSDVGLAVFK